MTMTDKATYRLDPYEIPGRDAYEIAALTGLPVFIRHTVEDGALKTTYFAAQWVDVND